MTVTASRRNLHTQTSYEYSWATPLSPESSLPVEPLSEAQEISGDPVHCGTVMTHADRIAASGASAKNAEEWVCACGFRMDARAAVPALQAVALAAGRLERLQWEFDAAEEELCAALREASASSVTASSLAKAAGLTLPELTEYLQRPAMGPAWNDLASLRFS